MAINPEFIKLSRQLRKDQTPWEKKLWMHLKGRKFYGLKFRRQMVIGDYIYDFGCVEQKLIIELDGSQHQGNEIKQKDAAKEEFARSMGYRILRFWNNDLTDNLEGLLERLKLEIESAVTSSVTRMHLPAGRQARDIFS